MLGSVVVLSVVGVFAQPAFYVAEDQTDQPAVARDGDVHLVVWTDRRSADTGADIYGARIRISDGAILDPGGFPICVEPGDQVGARLAAEAGTFLVAWTDRRAGNDDVYAARVRGNEVLDPGGFVVSASLLETGGGAADELRPFVAGSGDGMWLVAWEDWRRRAEYQGEVFVARIDADGTLLDPGGIRATTGDGGRDRLGGLVSNGRAFVALHGDGMFAHASVVRPDGSVLPEIAVGGSAAPFATGATAIATDGEGFLALWNQYDDAGGTAPQLRGRVLSPEGEPLGGDFSLGNAYDDPAVAWTGSDFLVVNGAPTETGHALFGARVSSGGTLAPGEPMLLARDAGSAAAASGAGIVLVVATREDDVLAAGVHFDGSTWSVEPADPRQAAPITGPADLGDCGAIPGPLRLHSSHNAGTRLTGRSDAEGIGIRSDVRNACSLEHGLHRRR